MEPTIHPSLSILENTRLGEAKDPRIPNPRHGLWGQLVAVLLHG